MGKEIILGTAQFGMNYGVTNTKGKIRKNDALKILKLASNLGIKTLDTAQDYGEAEDLIGGSKSIKSNFKINTKIIFDESEINSKFPLSSMYIKLKKSLKCLRTNYLNSLMIHNGSKLNINSTGLIDWFKICKKQNIIRSFGASIYQDTFLPERILKELDFVQIPFSLFNSEAEKNGIVKLCLKNKVQIHVRSIFCQGILLCEVDKLPLWCDKKDKEIFKKIKEFSAQNNSEMIDLACSYIQSKKWINSILIGLTSEGELKEIYKAFAKNTIFDFEKINKLSLNLSQKLIDPRRW